MPERRILRIGLDYGTSTSKLVVRDYSQRGGEQAYALEINRQLRFSSSVAMLQGQLLFGRSRNAAETTGEVPVWYDSLKMRIAMEEKRLPGPVYYGSTPAYPEGISGPDLVTLTIWHLLSLAAQAIQRKYQRDLADFRLGATMGIPMGFFDDPHLRVLFLGIARQGWWLFRQKGMFTEATLSLERARETLAEVKESVMPVNSIPESEVRNWIRSEAEAAMWWAFRSPSIPDGLYAKIDVGAGTTHASIFRIVAKAIGGKWVKESLAFFGAQAVPVGMDAIDTALASMCGIPPDRSVGLRGEENNILRRAGIIYPGVEQVIEEILKGYRRAWQQAYGKDRRTAAWREYPLFLLGGGSLVDDIRSACTVHPYLNERAGRPTPSHPLRTTYGSSWLGEAAISTTGTSFYPGGLWACESRRRRP